jgi:hypothetical protein
VNRAPQFDLARLVGICVGRQRQVVRALRRQPLAFVAICYRASVSSGLDIGLCVMSVFQVSQTDDTGQLQAIQTVEMVVRVPGFVN